MSKLTSEMVKKAALAAGADACGISDMSRFKNVPKELDPREVFPDAKSVIGMLFRIPHGLQRGIEEGTQFYQYPSMAYGGINEISAPAVIYHVGRLIEDFGYEANAYRNTGARGCVSDMDGTPGKTVSPEEHAEITDLINSGAPLWKHDYNRSAVARPAREGQVPPDLLIHFRLVGVACGLGEIGWSKMFLSPQFGSRQRLAFIFTDAELEPDPLYSGKPLCRRCMACVRECPGGCISKTESVKVDIGGKICEWGKLDEWKCYAFYTHGGPKYNPFVPREVWEKNENGDLDLLLGKKKSNVQECLKCYGELEKYFPSWVGYNMAKCGGCLRGCESMLEKKGGTLHGKFKNPLRTRAKPWAMDK